MIDPELIVKGLKCGGQAAIEYFIIFALVAGLTIISANKYWPQIRDALQGSPGTNGFFQSVAKGIIAEK